MTTETRTEIRWQTWSEAVFEQAKKENKLILLDSGATWCHWCHIMDRQTYTDPEVAELVNGRFIAVRIDRDRLPDVDGQFQRAEPLVNSEMSAGGWPLTAVLTPEGYCLFKATFLPPRPDERFGASIGLITILEKLDDYWQDHKDDVRQAGRQLQEELRAQTQAIFLSPGDLSPRVVQDIVLGIKDGFDSQHGGFGTVPKFFNPPALELLLAQSWAGDDACLRMLLKTLGAIAEGGVYDQIGGGFHRYSVDGRWHVPHFEKMAYDNAAMIVVYADACAMTGREDFARIARDTLAWMSGTLSDPDNKGFYSSQDADVGLEDDGDYFTWTAQEIRQAAGTDSQLATAHYGVDAVGDVPDRPGKNVLHVAKSAHELAEMLGRKDEDVQRAIDAARARMLAERAKRPTPAVDKTVFADMNGMCIDAYLTAWERLGEAAIRDKALAVLDHLLADLRDAGGLFAHYRLGDRLHGVGMLSDQAWMARALVHAYAATLRPQYLEAAEKLLNYIRAALASSDGGFLTGPPTAKPQPAVTEPMRTWEDGPGRSAASVAAQAMIDLGHLIAKDEYVASGAAALASFAGGARPEFGTFLAGYALAVDDFLHGPRIITVVGSPAHAENAELSAAARREYIPGGLVVSFDPSDPAGKLMLKNLGYAKANNTAAYVCQGKSCMPPARDISELKKRLGELKQRAQETEEAQTLRASSHPADA